MSKLEIAKSVIKENILQARHGIFNTWNVVGDTMWDIYNENDLEIRICYEYEYFEVFGLTEAEFEELEEYYHHWLSEYREVTEYEI